MSRPSKPGKGSLRQTFTKVKTARGRKTSSTQWLQRQLNDPFVAQARQEGYRSRAAYKLIEINDKCKILIPGKKVVDLGAAPGGWTQIAAHLVQAESKRGKGAVVGIDLLEMEPIAGAVNLQKDFYDEDIIEVIESNLGGKADIVLSDMAPNTMGHPMTDHLKIMGLCEEVIYFADQLLSEGGSLVVKIFRGAGEDEIVSDLRKKFKTIKRLKPASSRSESPEMYLVAIGYKVD